MARSAASPDQEQEWHRLASRAVRSLARFYEIVYGNDIFLPPGALSEVRRVVLRLGVSIQQLREFARLSGEMSWNMTPKKHCSQHFVSQAAIWNPIFVQCYEEESQIGSTTCVWKRSCSGRYRSGVQRMVLLKRLVSAVVGAESHIV